MRGRRRIIAAALALGVVGIAALVMALSAMAATSTTTDVAPAAAVAPPEAHDLPAPVITQAPPATSFCNDPAVQAAISAGDDESVIAAAGGATVFRDAVASANAPCVSLADPARRWVVVNKQRPFQPTDFAPQDLVQVQGLTTLNAGILRQDAAEALEQMAAAIEQAGVGRIGQLSGYRSYGTQISTYAENVADGGQAEADVSSARPGFSEHQSGMAVDLVSCAGGCGSIGEFGATAEGAWVAENAWQYGFIVRYEEGQTPTTGYEAEPWHLRFIGPALARAYHEGGFHTLETFFGLPAAPDYAG